MKTNFVKLMARAALKGVDEIPIGTVWIAEDGTILKANGKFCEERGYTTEEIVNLHIRDLNPLISTKGWRNYWDVVKQMKTNRTQSEHITKDGIIFPIETTSNYIEIDGKDVMFSVVSSLLERDKFEDLLEITSTYSKVVGWEWDRISSRYTYTSYLKKLCGNSSKLTGKESFSELLLGLFTKEQYAQFHDSFIKCREESEEFELDFRVIEDSGAEYWIRVTGFPVVVDESVIKIQGTIQDISKHRLFSDEMYLLKHSIDFSEDQVFWSGDDGKFAYANGVACKALGYSQNELYQLYVWDVVEITKDAWMVHWEELKRIGKMTIEHIQKSKEGHALPVRTKKYALEYEGQYYNMAIVRDISDEKKKQAQLEISLDKINELRAKLSQENIYLKQEILKEYKFRDIITKSDHYKKVLSQIQDVAGTEATVLIQGESGTGKELLANAVHELSDRKEKPFIKINCATLPGNLIESELFGHVKGAFTGAYADKMGRFELADEGTIFLDEIGEMPLDLQSKLLRVLQEGEFQPLGNPKTKTVDVRVVAATNRDLAEEVKNGRFREDLYFRLNVFPIHNIPLRQRRDDIPLLAQYFLNKFSDKMRKNIKGITPASIKRMLKYDYPGNVRELENIIERGVITNRRDVLTLPASLFVNKLADEKEEEGWVSFEDLQRNYITEVLEHTNWKVTGQGGAADILGLNGKTLYSKMTKLGISRK